MKSAHAAYRDHLEREKEMERKKKEEERRLKELAEKEKEEKELWKKKESLAKSEEGLDEQEKIGREELKASIDRNSLRTADLMLETASAAQQKAMTKLDKIREKQKQVGMKTRATG